MNFMLDFPLILFSRNVSKNIIKLVSGLFRRVNVMSINIKVLVKKYKELF